MENSVFEIVLVEDNPSDAEMTIRALRKNNLSDKLLHLSDGVEVLDFIFATGIYKDRNIAHKPKVILLDLKMPKLSGIEVLKKIKSDDRTKSIPIVILTSSKEDPDIQECYSLGANGYIVKPVGYDNFTKAISELGLYWTILNQPPV